MKKKLSDSISSTQTIVFGFLAIILIGTALLMLPAASAEGRSTPLVDALFTATSATCVTGLMTLPVYSHWSLFGQIILLILIQIGGLGIVACTFTIFAILGRRITMRGRMLIHEAYALDTFHGTGRIVLRIFKGTLLAEFIGAVLYGFCFIPEYGILKGIWYSVFHSVSAFCNSGIDLIGDSSFCRYVDNAMVNFTTVFLITVGGIGFCVWWDIQRVVKNAFMQRKFRRQLFHRLSIHSKLAIVTSLILVVGGAGLLLLFEWNNPGTYGSMTVRERLMAALFQSVTNRTAGFATVLQENYTDAGTIINLLLMFIGGSPAGTAGGVKTTTVAMLVMTVAAVIQGKQDTEIFRRKVPAENIRTGLTVVCVSFLILLSGIMLLSIFEKTPVVNVAYEAVSALATVGLSRSYTASMGNAGKIIVIILMFIGRIGPVTMALAFRVKRKARGEMRELAEGRILVG